MGFCIFANVSLAAAEAVERFQLRSVLIVDFDVHHGNGTQEIFYDSERVGFLSIHRYPFYPGSGVQGRDGTGRGPGSHVEHPRTLRYAEGPIPRRLPPGSNPRGQAQARTGADRAGFDAHAEDPVATWDSKSKTSSRSRRKSSASLRRISRRIVSVLEGGYNVPILAGCVAAHLRRQPGRIRLR